MKTPKLNMKMNLDLKSFVPLLLKRFSLVLWILLGLVILAEGWVLKSSTDKILTANDQSQFAGAQLVRVNFTAYEQIEQRLNSNNQFLPPEPETADPFGSNSD